MSDDVVLQLSSDAALVLLVLVGRLNESETMSFEDQAEQRVLWDLEADLERAISAVTSGDFQAQVQAARDSVRDAEE